MKKIYEAPKAEVIDLVAMQQIALIEDDNGNGKPGGISQGVGGDQDF